MNRRNWLKLSGAAMAAQGGRAQTPQEIGAPPPSNQPGTPEALLLKDYHPKSLYRVPVSDINKAKYPVIDVHCHGARPIEKIDEMVQVMDAVGIQKTVIFTAATSAERFNEVRKPYDRYPGRFDLWASFDFTGVDQPGWGPKAVKALDECRRAGALGIGELSDKGRGLGRFGGGRGFPGRGGRNAAAPPASLSTIGPHIDDPRLDPLIDKCAQLGMPINIHVSDPFWSYQPMDNHNDGYMNGYTWRINLQPGMYGHDELIDSLEKAVLKHPKTMFIACHLANLDYDLTRLGRMFDRAPNLHADISARFAETAPIPRFVNQFFHKYPDRILYGTDMAYNQRMFSATFRILESNDEHFYEQDLNFNFNYHWPLYGFGLPDAILKKVYHDNAAEVFRKARAHATA